MTAVDLREPTLRQLVSVFALYPELAEVRLFGSRATGSATNRSDIDLATIGITDRHRLGRLMLDLDDLPIAQVCDVVGYEMISNPLLRGHIDRVGVTIWRGREAPE